MKRVFFWAALLTILEYHCSIWYQLDLPVYIYESYNGMRKIFYRLTQVNNPLFQWIAMAVLYQLNVYFIRRGLALLKKNDWIVSFLFACVFVVGYSYNQQDSLVLLSWNRILLMASAACILSYTLLAAAVVSVLRGFFRHPILRDGALPRIWSNHPFLFPMLILLLGWLPYAAVRYPAGMEYDAFEQIQQVLTGELRANNPLISTLFFGYGFILGRNLFNSVNAGLFLVVACQMILCAGMDAYALLVMHKKKAAPYLQLGVLLVYALSPFVARYTTSIVKDTLYSHAVLFLVAALVDITDWDAAKGKRKLILLTAAGFAVCFLRNNGIIVVGTAAAVAFMSWMLRRYDKTKLLVLCSMVIPLCAYMLFSNVIIPALGIRKWRTSEILSVPFQQTARLIVSREELITEEEKNIIDSVLDYERVKANYDPRLSDPVKMTYRGDKEALKTYLKYWAGDFLEHPVVYLSATFNNCYGFFYPDAREDEDAMGIYRDSRWDQNLLQAEYNVIQNKLVMNFGTMIRYLEKLPMFYPLCNVAIQIWLFLWMFTSKTGKGAKCKRAVMVPVFASVLALIGMPTFSWNGFRYALPVIISVPFLFGMFINDQVEQEDMP